MNKNKILTPLAFLLLGIISGYLLAQTNSFPGIANEKKDFIPDGMHRMPDGSLMGNRITQSDKGMMNGTDHSMMLVASEKEFITEMIPHHQEAVDTAKEVLARGATTPEIRKLVENIITAQEKETANMKSWHQEWYGTSYQPSGNYKPMMRDLTNLKDKDIDKAFLEDMVMHHMGAIMMAHSVQPYIQHEQIKTLTKAIISSQTEEIKEMKRLQAAL